MTRRTNTTATVLARGLEARARIMYVMVTATLLGACVDTVPKPYTGDGQDGGGADATPSLEAGLLVSCRACVTGDGGACRPQYDACLGVPKCQELIECGFETGCLILPTLEQRVACAQPCFTSVGITNTSDPGLAAGLQINACTLGPCASACGGP